MVSPPLRQNQSAYSQWCLQNDPTPRSPPTQSDKTIFHNSSKECVGLFSILLVLLAHQSSSDKDRICCRWYWAASGQGALPLSQGWLLLLRGFLFPHLRGASVVVLILFENLAVWALKLPVLSRS